MNSFSTAVFLVNAAMLVVLPRRWAPLSLLIGACYITVGSEIEIGTFHLTVIRLLVAVGIVRVVIRGERLSSKLNGLDWTIMLWASWALMSSLFHIDTSGVLVNRLGLVYNALGIYFLLRIFCQSLDDVVTLCRVIAIVLVPLSIEMLFEKMTGHNLFSVLNDIAVIPEVRDGRVRAQGPFGHSILAGTVGGVCLPLMIGLWEKYRKTAAAGILACFLIIFASTSSGPIMSAVFAIGALLMWHWRHRMRLIRWLAILSYIGLDAIMNAPAYYILARIDLTGSSTSWHRAAIIEAAFSHLSEWWFAGTDLTGHWMPYAVTWRADQADITNYYLRMGVDGGLLLMLLLIAELAVSFSFVGRILKQRSELPHQSQFMIWAFGAALLTHSITFLSVSYFDQTFVFIYLTFAVIGSVWSETIKVTTKVFEQRQSPGWPALAQCG